jgi:serine/threonine-protein kinase
MMNPSQTIGPYQIVQPLAAGGMGQVFLAKKTGEGGVEMTCVVKTLLAAYAGDAEFVRMFLREARILASLRHQNIVQLFDCGRVDGTLYLAMEYVEGHDLRDMMTQAGGRPLPLAVALRIAIEALNGLAYAHTRVGDDGRPLNLVHRDLTPTNILLSREGAVKLVDFGIAKDAVSEDRTIAGVIKGKLQYMSPEQLDGRPLDARADLFAMGLVLYELATGVRPFAADTTSPLFAKVLHGEYTPASVVAGTPQELDRLLAKALAKRAEDRFASAAAMLADVEKLALAVGALPINGLRDYYRDLFESPRLPHAAADETGSADEQTVGRPRLAPAPASASAPPVPWKAPPRWIGAIVLPAAILVAAGAWALFSGKAVVPRAETSSVRPAAPAHSTTGPTAAANPAPASPPGRIKVAPDVDCDVYLDGKLIGATPLASFEAAAGQHELLLRNENLGVAATVPVTVAAEKTARVAATLMATLVVKVIRGTKVYVDSTVLGLTPLPPTPVKPGPHQIRLVHAALGKDVAIQRTFTAGAVTRIDEDLTK